jgi:hypothetical protein
MELVLVDLLKKHKEFIAQNDLYNIINYGREYRVKSGAKIDVEKGALYLIQRGTISMEYIGAAKVANSSGYNMFSLLHEGMTVGVVELNCPEISFEYVAQSDVDYVKYSSELFFKNITQGGQYSSELVQMLFYMVSFLACVVIENSSDKSYAVIRAMIYRYKERIELNLHMNESLVEFITKRSSLSKSYVFKIVADLKKGGYITVRAGKLESINTTLPAEY